MVTFLFTDVEGSTSLLERHPEAYRGAIAQHHDMLARSVAQNRGEIFETVGDAVYAAFASPADAVTAAFLAQQELHNASWGETGPLRVRMGLHTGEVERQGDHYFGAALYRCARLSNTAHGGQVVLSSATAELVREGLPIGASLRDLGERRLRICSGRSTSFSSSGQSWLRTFRRFALSTQRRATFPFSPRRSSAAPERWTRRASSSSSP